MPKGKGRGRGPGKGRAKGNQQQETRPGRAENEDESEKRTQPSASRPSLSQATFQQPKHPQASQKEQQSKPVTHATGRDEKVAIHPCSISIASSVSQANLQGESSIASSSVPQANLQGDDGRKSNVAKKAAIQEQKQLPSVSERVVPGTASKRKIPQGVKESGAVSKPPAEGLVQGVKGLTITHAIGHAGEEKDWYPPRRPGFGTAGKEISLSVNFFRLRVPPNQYMYHYDVEIEPSRCPRRIKHRIVEAVITKYSSTFKRRKPAFDGQKNLYSREEIPVGKNGIELNVELPDEDGGKNRTYKVCIKFAAHVNLTELTDFLSGKISNSKLPQDSIQALDIVLRQQPNLRFTPVGRSFFPLPGSDNNQPQSLGGGCEVWFGYYQSVRPSQWKTMLINIDVSAKGFYKEQEVIELLCQTLRRSENDIGDRRFQMKRHEKSEFVQAIKGLRIVATHIKEFKKKCTVIGLSDRSASNLTFNLEDKTPTTVERYFNDRYHHRLRFPHLPCLEVGKGTFLPMEVCKLIPCPKRKLTDDQISELIRHTAKPAYERKRKIENWAAECQRISGKYLKDEFGMAMNTKMEQVTGRVLDQPPIRLGKESKQQELLPYNGVWDMREKTFYSSGSTVTSWVMFCYVNRQRCDAKVLRNFCEKLMFFSDKAGMKISTFPCVVDYIRKDETMKKFDEVFKKEQGNLQLIVAVVPDKGNKDIYEEVKQVGDVILGIPTQCVQFKQVRGAKAQVCSNIAMKINAKMGGINHIPINPDQKFLLKKPTIIIGADVTHPSAGDTKTPSIAAVVASLDPNASRYCATVRVQDHRQEIIEDLSTMVKQCMIQFRNKLHTKPQKIIFYRDGVSEGQFDQVLRHEVRAVQDACVQLEPSRDYQPGITFVVVQKRHHVRFFPNRRDDECGKAGNIPPGTTVDQGITHPFEFDFYLCSHYGIQGTSKPTHYHVIYDDNNFDADSLQKLTYQLCYTFARCPRSVSMPAPAYYAHLAAFRARNHLSQVLHSSEGSAADNLKAFSDAVKVKDSMASEMYFV